MLIEDVNMLIEDVNMWIEDVNMRIEDVNRWIEDKRVRTGYVGLQKYSCVFNYHF